MPLQKAGEIPRESTIYCLTVDDEQADAGRDGRIRLAMPYFQAETGRRQKTGFLFS